MRIPVAIHIIALAFIASLGGVSEAAAQANSGPAAEGQVLFQRQCASCHAVQNGKQSVMGPNLAGVLGRQAGSGSFTYSPALKGTGVVWTRENLDRYLSGPAKMVPGTRMMATVADAGRRQAIIDYLETLR